MESRNQREKAFTKKTCGGKEKHRRQKRRKDEQTKTQKGRQTNKQAEHSKLSFDVIDEHTHDYTDGHALPICTSCQPFRVTAGRVCTEKKSGKCRENYHFSEDKHCHEPGKSEKIVSFLEVNTSAARFRRRDKQRFAVCLQTASFFGSG